MTLPDIRTMALTALTTMMLAGGGAQSALAHWGHLGELAGHGHLAGAALGAAAAILAAALPARIRDQVDSEENAAETSAADDEPQGDPVDA